MPDLIVIRDEGNNQGDDIIDPLIPTNAVGVSRGRAELDHNASEKAVVQYETVYRTGVRLGQLVEVQDNLAADVFRAKVVGMEHQIGTTGAVTRLSLEREISF